MTEKLLELSAKLIPKEDSCIGTSWHKYSVLTHQVTQLQMYLEAARTGQTPAQTAGVPKYEPKLQKLDD